MPAVRMAHHGLGQSLMRPASERLRSIARFAYRHSSPGKLIRGLRYPGIHISGSARLDVRGRFAYGAGCTIGVGSNLIVKNTASLGLGDLCAIGRYVELGPDQCIEIGSETSIQDRSILLGDVTLGRYCSLAPNVYISSGRHWFELESHELIKDQDRMAAEDERLSSEHSRPVTVEDDCWVGVNSVVMPGVTIGKGSIIGAGSVVTRDVSPYSVMAGTPARLLRKRFEFVSPAQIDAARPLDRPYFYSGFEVSRRLMHDLPVTGGIAARGAFVLSLDATAGTSLHLVVRSADGAPTALKFGDQSAEISGSFAEIAFNLDSRSGNRMRVDARGSAGPATIYLQRAFIR